MADKRQNVKINYLSRDFTSIKSQLLEHARRYYPETFKDFSDAGFGALMIDAVSYVGDLLSFYVDYQANESFLSTAIEYDNIIKHGDAVGFKYDNIRATYGQVDLYIKIPANSNNTGPDLSYAPKVRAGTTFSSTNGSLFTLLEDVDFADATNEVVVATTNASTGIPVQFAIKTIGQVVSGELRQKTFEIGNFSRFTTLTIFDGNVTEIISVFDSCTNVSTRHNIRIVCDDVSSIYNFNNSTSGWLRVICGARIDTNMNRTSADCWDIS